MGLSLTKTPLERRNTVVRRSQRKSIHHTKARVLDLMRDIKKFQGTDDDASYQDLISKLESLRRDLDHKRKDLQPQVRPVYQETSKKLDDCSEFLANKVKENKEKATKKQAEDAKKQTEEAAKKVDETESKDETDEEETTLPETNRKTVELNLVRMETATPEQKRVSVMKIGIPVMPVSIMDSIFRKTHHFEEVIADIRREIESIEIEISQFVGRRNGKHYNRLKEQLQECCGKLLVIDSNDEAIKEQVKLCNSYVNSCFSFLDEKAVDVEESDDDVFESNRDSYNSGATSPRNMKVTYI